MDDCRQSSHFPPAAVSAGSLRLRLRRLGALTLLEHFRAHTNTVEFLLPKLFLLEEMHSLTTLYMVMIHPGHTPPWLHLLTLLSPPPSRPSPRLRPLPTLKSPCFCFVKPLGF